MTPPQATSEQSCIATYHMTRPPVPWKEEVRVWVRFPRITQLTIIVVVDLIAFHSLSACRKIASVFLQVQSQQTAAKSHFSTVKPRPGIAWLNLQPNPAPPPIDITPLPIQSFPPVHLTPWQSRGLSHPSHRISSTNTAIEASVASQLSPLLFPRSDPTG